MGLEERIEKLEDDVKKSKEECRLLSERIISLEAKFHIFEENEKKHAQANYDLLKDEGYKPNS